MKKDKSSVSKGWLRSKKAKAELNVVFWEKQHLQQKLATNSAEQVLVMHKTKQNKNESEH